MACLSFLVALFLIFGVVSSLPVEQAQDMSVDMAPESTTVSDEIDQPTISPDQGEDLTNAETALGFIGIGIPVYGGYGGYGGGYYRRPYWGGGYGGYGGGWGHHHHHHHGHFGHHGHGHWG